MPAPTTVTVMSLNLLYGGADGRWAGLARRIRQVGPQVLLVQEATGWYDGPVQSPRMFAVQEELGMRGEVAPSPTGFHTGIFIEETDIAWGEWITKYNHATFQGHAELTVDVGLPGPLTLVCAHLNPHSAAAASQEAQLLVQRVYRNGPYGLIGGDLNHVPPGDREPDWEQVTAPNRASRTILGQTPLRADTSVGQALAAGDLVDVAAHLADVRGDPSLRAWTAPDGQLRCDQFHLTPALLPALVDYQRVDTGEDSDHDGVVMVLDLTQIT